MRNEKWRMENGEWGMGNGEWRMFWGLGVALGLSVYPWPAACTYFLGYSESEVGLSLRGKREDKDEKEIGREEREGLDVEMQF